MPPWTWLLCAARSGLRIDGADGYHLEGTSPMSGISRDPVDLVEQLLGDHLQYLDGVGLYLGTMANDDRRS